MLYPVPQKAPHVSAGMNVLNLPEGKRSKATDVSRQVPDVVIFQGISPCGHERRFFDSDSAIFDDVEKRLIGQGIHVLTVGMVLWFWIQAACCRTIPFAAGSMTTNTKCIVFRFPRFCVAFG